MAYVTSFIFGVLIGCCTSENRNIYGPKCLSCTGVHDPAECSSATTCWASQKCYAERYMHANGRLLYDFGCKIKEECELLSESRNRRLDITIDLCEECCDGDFCNVNTCGNRTESFTTACYACQDQDNPDDCHQLKRCGQGEICYAEKLITDSPHPRYTLDCLSQQVCSYLNNGAQPIGKRSTHLCQKCCSTSGCNVDICGDNQAQQTTNTVTHGNTTATTTYTRYTTPYTTPSTTPYTTPSTTPYTTSSTTLNSTASTTDRLPVLHSVRLVNGSLSSEGRVEILYRGVWGTICDDGFGTKEAGVICHMLGHLRDGAQMFPRAYFGPGRNPIWLDSVSCNGYENDIFRCSHNVAGNHDCTHKEDVGVKCVRSSDPVRLVGGGASNEGRVEIYYKSQWETICDDRFGSTEAGVVCHMLGYRREGATALANAHFGQGNGNILLDDVSCTGNETSVWLCRHRPVESHNCGHNEDVGVTCELPHCPHGFLTHSGSCYSFGNSSSVKSYVQAAAECSDLNATLVDVETVEEYEYIANVVRSVKGSTGEWLTGVRYVSMGWMLGDLETPLNRDLTHDLVRGPCLSFMINHSYSWVDVNCDGLPRNYICEKPLV